MAIYDKLANINGKSYGVYDEESFQNNMPLLLTDEQSAVEIKTPDGNYILPVRNGKLKDKSTPGVYRMNDHCCLYSLPITDEEKAKYNPSGDDLLIFSDNKQIQDLVSAKERYDNSINKLLEVTDAGLIFKPPLLEDDTAAMRALKECIIAKSIDIDKYADRFGESYSNDKRKLKERDISLKLLTRICDNLDINVEITFKDKNTNVPNPMNTVITANINPGDDEISEEDNLKGD